MNQHQGRKFRSILADEVSKRQVGETKTDYVEFEEFVCKTFKGLLKKLQRGEEIFEGSFEGTWKDLEG